MGRDGLSELHFALRDPTSVLQGGDADMIAGLPTGKQPQAGMRSLTIGAQNIEQTWRQHRVAILRALAAFDGTIKARLSGLKVDLGRDRRTAANSDAIRPPIEQTCSFGAAGRSLRWNLLSERM